MANDLFDVLFNNRPHPPMHSWHTVLCDYADGEITTAQIKAKLISEYGLDAQGENQVDAFLGLIDAQTHTDAKVQWALRQSIANLIGHLCTSREDGFLYDTDAKLKTRLGF